MRGKRAKFIRNLTMMSNKINFDMIGETVKRVVRKRNMFGIVVDKVTVKHHPESPRGLYRRLKRIAKQNRFNSNISPYKPRSRWGKRGLTFAA